ncbi:MAG TPA: hypothetical protein VHD76_05265 [Bryobacteraceae bacterium]|jgi:hypothetical protein|nr:hypothetical protein [Bryobacteraceae bacterium]
MSLWLRCARSAAVAVLALAAPSAFADTIVTGTFTDAASWAAAADQTGEITFDGVAPLGSYSTYGSAAGYTSDGITFIGQNGSGYLEQIVDAAFQNPFNNWGSGGSLTSAQYVSTGFSPIIHVVLPAGVTAFAVDLGSLSPNGMGVQITLDSGDTFSVPTGARPDLAFFGVTTSAAVNYVDFMLVGADPDNGSQLLMDNFAVGTAAETATPEAGTLGLIGLGLVFLPALRRRASSSQAAGSYGSISYRR